MLKTCSVTNKALKNQYLGSETSDWSRVFYLFGLPPDVFCFLVLALFEEGKGGKFYQLPVAHSTIVDFCLLVFHTSYTLLKKQNIWDDSVVEKDLKEMEDGFNVAIFR